VGEESTRLRLRVTPGAARPAVVGRYGESWKIAVAAAPERGRANDAVVALLADTLSLPRNAVELVSGHGARDKIVEVSGISPDETDRRLAQSAEREESAR
jgi:uncharacterized protein YggU (UPF0235/DUF167 family)